MAAGALCTMMSATGGLQVWLAASISVSLYLNAGGSLVAGGKMVPQFVTTLGEYIGIQSGNSAS